MGSEMCIRDRVNKMLDDSSDENLEKIHLMGMEWWSDFGDETIQFLEI